MTRSPYPTDGDLPDMEALAALIVRKQVYIDTVGIWLHMPLNRDGFRSLKGLCGTVIPNTEPMKHQPWWRQRQILHQPTETALRWILRRAPTEGRDYLINEVAVKIEYVTRDWRDGEIVANFLGVHLVQPWRRVRTQRISTHHGTMYWSHRKRPRNQPVVYCDGSKPSKVTGEPAVQLEWRIFGAGPIRDKGIEGLEHLIRFDHRAFWDKWLRLEAIDRVKLGRAFYRTRRRGRWVKDGRDMDMFAAILIAKGSQQEDTTGRHPRRPLCCVEDIKESAARDGLNIRRALVRLDPWPFLPDN